MSLRLRIVIFIVGLISISFNSHASCVEDTSSILNLTDTTTIFNTTDSLVIIELKKYDEQSQRQTGVPRALQHYTKYWVEITDKKMIIVYYSFSDRLFYGDDKTVTI